MYTNKQLAEMLDRFDVIGLNDFLTLDEKTCKGLCPMASMDCRCCRKVFLGHSGFSMDRLYRGTVTMCPCKQLGIKPIFKKIKAVLKEYYKLRKEVTNEQ